LCASYIELSKAKYKAPEVVDAAARAVEAANACTSMMPSWAKGWLRQSTAEEALLKARTRWEEQKAREKTKWDLEDEERNGPPFAPEATQVKTIAAMSLATCEATCRKGLKVDSSSFPLKLRLQAIRDEGGLQQEADGGGHATDEALDREMADVSAAMPLKAEGNAAFSAKRFEEAATKYTEALAHNPFDHVFYSNRSACYAELDEGAKALRDADLCIKLNKEFAKGYSRRSAALYQLGRYVEAEAAAKAGLLVDPSSSALQSLLETAQVETKETHAVQAQMYQLRKKRKEDEKMKKLLSGLNLGGQGFNVFSPGQMGSGGLESLFGGGGGGGGMGGLNGADMHAPAMTDDQMRQIARATAAASSATTEAGGAAATDIS
jgi:tetratricopeptide (TPR) repeat protein